MQIDLLEKSFKNVNHDAGPKIGMVIRLKTTLSKQVAISCKKITLVLDTTGNKTKPFLAGLLIGVGPSIRRNVKHRNADFSQEKASHVMRVCARIY